MSTYNSRGLTTSGAPPMPAWLTIVRGVIILLSLGVLIAAAYNISLFDGFASDLSGYSGPAGFLIFDAIFTWLILGLMLGFEFFADNLFVRIAFVVALALDAIFWLSAWAWAADLASASNSVWWGGKNSYGSSMAAGAALGAITWVLVLVTLGFFIRACLLSHDGAAPATVQTAELGQVRHEPKNEVVPHPPVEVVPHPPVE